jgi:hypothetical protein
VAAIDSALAHGAMAASVPPSPGGPGATETHSAQEAVYVPGAQACRREGGEVEMEESALAMARGWDSGSQPTGRLIGQDGARTPPNVLQTAFVCLAWPRGWQTHIHTCRRLGTWGRSR